MTVLCLDLDWAALLRREITPPIDLGMAHLMVEGGHGELRGPEITDADITTHFHEGFTAQQISPSVIEESYSVFSSPARSRAGSQDEMDFADFDYAGMTFQCTPEQVEEFHQSMAIKVAKLEKKKLMKQKKEEKKTEKAAGDAETARLAKVWLADSSTKDALCLSKATKSSAKDALCLSNAANSST